MLGLATGKGECWEWQQEKGMLGMAIPRTEQQGPGASVDGNGEGGLEGYWQQGK